MAGNTGYTAVTNASPMLGPAQITDVYEHFDPLIGESVASAASLPSTGNWEGRAVMARDTDALYLCTGLPNTWKRVYSSGTAFAEAVGLRAMGGLLADGAQETVSITFPVGRFTVAPRMFTSTNGIVIPFSGSVTTSGFTLGVRNVSGSALSASGVQVSWRAVQMTSSAADG